MQINVRTSADNHDLVRDLTQKMKLGTENHISRIAFAYSIAKGVKVDLSEIQDSKGKEYKEDILFGQFKGFYIALVCQHYGLYKSDKDLGRYIKMHIDDGLERINKLFENNPNYDAFDFLLEHIERGVAALEDAEVPEGAILFDEKIRGLRVDDKDSYTESIKIIAGYDLDSGAPIHFYPNDITRYNNCHIAIAGNSGTGKTQFALDFLKQITKTTQQKVNFLYLDFKGLKNDDVDFYQPFFEATGTTFIDAPHIAFPLNPITFIDNVNEKNKIMGINKLVDIIGNYANLGKRQVQQLKDAVRNAFDKKKGGEYPSFQDIYDKTLEITGDEPSRLREVLEGISELELFEKENTKQFLSNNYYLSLSGDLPSHIRFTATFLIINYLYNTFMNMENTPVEGENKGIRYVLLIDEAHVIFKERKAQDLLEKILREIRSKGVSVVLLSQGIREFIQPSFDFSSMCEIAFLLDIKDKNNIRMMSQFLGMGQKESGKITRSMEKIEKGQAISNLKEIEKGRLFLLSQLNQ
jgi:DNA sulfur modification protein DndE